MPRVPRSFTYAALLVGCCPRAATSAREEPPPVVARPVRPVASACTGLPFFARYAAAGMATSPASGVVRLELTFDVHGADCGAPDCYGHDSVLELAIAGEGTRCRVLGAGAESRPFNRCGVPPSQVEPPWTNAFRVHGAADLANPELDRVELRDETRGDAVLLLRDGFFFYRDVTDGGTLHPALPPDAAAGCCYGSTGSRALDWSRDR